MATLLTQEERELFHSLRETFIQENSRKEFREKMAGFRESEDSIPAARRAFIAEQQA